MNTKLVMNKNAFEFYRNLRIKPKINEYIKLIIQFIYIIIKSAQIID